MERGAAGFRSTLHVRLMHAFVRRRVGQLSQWRADAWGVPVSQSDMAGTYLVFAVAFLVGLRVLGVPVTDDDARAVVHLWRYVGWLMGVEDRWLIEDEAAGRFLLLHVALSQPEPDESCALLGRALMDEPLSREYPNLGWLRGPLNRSRHLSVTRLFVSGPQLRALGLPRFGVPWYPLLSAPLTLAWHGLHRLLPGGQERLARSGRARQQALLRPQFGEQRPTLGRLHGT